MGQMMHKCFRGDNDKFFLEDDKNLRDSDIHYSRNSIVESINRAEEDEATPINILTDSPALAAVGQKVSFKDFQVLKMLGQGSFGLVLLVEKTTTKTLYAMKVIDKDDTKKRNSKKYMENERIILKNTKHPFAIKLFYAFQTQEKLYLVMDFQQGGDLSFHIRKNLRFRENIVRFIIAELVLVLDHLHGKKIVYRDLKPANILFGVDGHIKVADFGLSKWNLKKGDTTHTLVGTPEYLAPEIYMEPGYTHMCDWWSLGSLMYELMTGRPPFYSKDKNEMFRKRHNQEVEIKNYFSKHCASLIKGLLVNDPRKRLTAVEIKAHPFFSGLDWSALYKKEIPSPINIEVSDQMDLRYFDKLYTEQNPQMQDSIPRIKPSSAAYYTGFSYENASIKDTSQQSQQSQQEKQTKEQK